MSETTKQWVHGCAIGCGALAIFSIFLLVGFTVSMRGAFVDAHHDRDVLQQQFGTTEDYTPAADGCVAPDRLSVFLDVREALTEVHARVVSVDAEMGEFEKLTENGEPPMRVALPAVARLTKSMLGLPKVFGEIEKGRNKALVEAGMGLGEYTYIYVMAYHDEIVDPKGNVYLFGASAANSRVREDLRGMIERQLGAVQADDAQDETWVATLTGELAALGADPDRVPWSDGLPALMAACFDSHRGKLNETYSAAAAEFDLLNSTVSNGGLQITMD